MFRRLSISIIASSTYRRSIYGVEQVYCFVLRVRSAHGMWYDNELNNHIASKVYPCRCDERWFEGLNEDVNLYKRHIFVYSKFYLCQNDLRSNARITYLCVRHVSKWRSDCMWFTVYCRRTQNTNTQIHTEAGSAGAEHWHRQNPVTLAPPRLKHDELINQ